MRHASRFSTVQAIAGAPSWLQYSGGGQRRRAGRAGDGAAVRHAAGRERDQHRLPLLPRPPRPRPDEARATSKSSARTSRTLGVPFKETWFDAGHDLLYLVHRHGKIYDDLEPHARASAAERSARRHRRLPRRAPALGRGHAHRALPGARARARGRRRRSRSRVETQQHARARARSARRAARRGDAAERSRWTAQVVSRARARRSATSCTCRATRRRWRNGVLRGDRSVLEKQPGSSGPITDAYFDAMVHVYGTGDPARPQR